MDSPQEFGNFNQIDFNELQFLEVVGRGAFGVVSRARWKNIDVAVKLIETESEKKAFMTELKQLSRVSHPNIVDLYGACTIQPVCLVMEYAEGGSLYNVLHGSGPQPEYTAGHAISWALQCARGVEYLHGMKPKALIHRDLKPPNLLLIHGGTVLKICDFGTACDAQTHMTNNKGSAAWMAPEVFEGSVYSEKCDVFSWGIILWEVITRKKPFDEIGGPAFRIMWAVHNGTRPPLIKSLPKPIEILMTRCWSATPSQRPSMAEVTRIMTHLMQFFQGANEPLVYPVLPTPEDEGATPLVLPNSSVYDTPPLSNVSQAGGAESRASTLHDTVRQALKLGEPVPYIPTTPKHKPLVIEEDHPRRTSAPASLAASRESLLDGKGSRSSTPSVEVNLKRYSADLSKLEELDILRYGGSGFGQAQTSQPSRPKHGHRRSGSYGTSTINITHNNPAQAGDPPVVRGHRRTGSFGNTPVTTSTPISGVETVSPARPPIGSTAPGMTGAQFTSPSHHGGLHHVASSPDRLGFLKVAPPPTGAHRSNSWTVGMPGMNPAAAVAASAAAAAASRPNVNENRGTAMTMGLVALDHKLQPLAPCPNAPESMAVFNEHCKLAQEYQRVQTEIRLLRQRKVELERYNKQMDEYSQHSSTQLLEEFTQLTSENESLRLLHKNLKKQVEQMLQRTRQGGV